MNEKNPPPPTDLGEFRRRKAAAEAGEGPAKGKVVSMTVGPRSLQIPANLNKPQPPALRPPVDSKVVPEPKAPSEAEKTVDPLNLLDTEGEQLTKKLREQQVMVIWGHKNFEFNLENAQSIVDVLKRIQHAVSICKRDKITLRPVIVEIHERASALKLRFSNTWIKDDEAHIRIGTLLEPIYAVLKQFEKKAE